MLQPARMIKDTYGIHQSDDMKELKFVSCLIQLIPVSVIFAARAISVCKFPGYPGNLFFLAMSNALSLKCSIQVVCCTWNDFKNSTTSQPFSLSEMVTVKFVFLVKIYQNRSDVITRRACTAWIINNLLSITVKWMQKLELFTVRSNDK